MSARLLRAVFAGSLLALTLAPAHAQQRDTVVADTTRPFLRGGIHDKPFLTRLGARTTLGGYAEAHARYERSDGATTEAGLVARRFNLFAHSRVSDVVRVAAELEVEEGGEEIKLEFAAIDVRVHPAFTLRGGVVLAPIGRFNLAHDSPLNEFTDRPLVAVELIGVALSEPALGALGQFGVGHGGRLTYEAYLTNGFSAGLLDNAEGGTRIPLGRGNHEDNNAEPAAVGRVAWSPAVGTEFGASVHHGAYNDFRVDGVRVDTRRTVGIAAVDAEFAAGDTRVAGEIAWARVDVPGGLRPLYASRQHGWYVEAVRPFGRGAVRTLPSSQFAIKVRLDAVDHDADVDGDDTRQVSAGVNFRPGEDTVMKLDYVRGRTRDRFAVATGHARLLFSIATYF